MNNIFSKAYFGKAYRTRNDRKAIYLFSVGCGVYCITENFQNKIRYYHFSGIPYDFEFSKYRGDDIVSEWQEPIDEMKLDELAKDEAQLYSVVKSKEWQEGFKAGFHKVIEYLTNNNK